MRQAFLPLVGRTIRNNPTLLQVTGKATAMVRNLNIKPYQPARRQREQNICNAMQRGLHISRNQIYREKGHGAHPTIILAGFVPDATEVIEFQRPILKNRGAIYYVNYARTGFDQQLFYAQLADLIDDINARGETPSLLGISFGAGLVVDFLRQQLIKQHNLSELLLISPVLCMNDLVRDGKERDGGVRMLESCLKRIIKASDDGKADLERQVERARRCFQALFEAGAENRHLTSRHLGIRKKIMDVIESTTAKGGYERLLAMRTFQAPTAGEKLYSGPTLLLFAEAEESILVANSPTLKQLRDPVEVKNIFPLAKCREISSGNSADPVPHASLIFHHEHYNQALAEWFCRQHELTRMAV